MTKRMISILLCVAMLLTLMPVAALAEEYPSLTLNEEVTINVEKGGTYWYQFVPTTTQAYVFRSYDNDVVDPFAMLYDAEKNEITRNDDSDGRNFRVVAKLTAGETYFLEMYDWGKDDVGAFKLMVSESMPTDMYIDESAITRFVGAEYTLTTYVYPDGAVGTITWTSSDESVATVDENGKVTCHAGGEATITAETVNGITDTCDVVVMAFDGTVALGETTFVVTEDEVTKKKMLAFTPAETGYYRLYSHDIVTTSENESVDPRVRVYDEEYDLLKYSDDDGGEGNFRAEIPMEAGKTYYCEFSLYNPDATGSYKATIEKMLNATSVTINSGDIVMDQGESREMKVTYAPEGCWIENYTITSSDENIVAVRGHDFDALGAGEVSLTVTTDLGLTDTITVTVHGAIPMELDTTYTVEGTAEYEGGWDRYSFTPTVSGRYTIASREVVGEGATANVILSELGGQLRDNDTESDSFSLTYELEAGVTYYYDVTVECDAAESAVSFMLTKADDSAIPEAKIYTDLSVNITNPGDGVYYVFKPTVTGEYKLFSQYDVERDLDPKLIVYNADWEQIAYHDDINGSSDRNFCLEKEFTAGETYYLKAITYASYITDEYTMRIEPLLESATVSGTVSGVEDDTHVVIWFTEEGLTEPAYEVTLDGNGEFSIEDMPLATYEVKVTAEGYETVTETVVVDGDQTLAFEMEAAKAVYTVLFYLDEADEYALFGYDVEEGECITQPAEPAQEGKNFLGWFVGDTLYDFSAPVTGNLSLVAKFEVIAVEPEFLKGDVNLDGKVDLNDATALFYHVNGLALLDGDKLSAADVNGDGKEDLNDSTALFYLINGLITAL